jgi:hypothetical protein
MDLNPLENDGMESKRKKSEPVAPLSPARVIRFHYNFCYSVILFQPNKIYFTKTDLKVKTSK